MSAWDPIKLSADALRLVVIQVNAPPCATCKHWNPVARTESDGRPSSARLCHAPDMFNDFSCHEERG